MQRYTSSIKDGRILIHANISDIPIRKNMFMVFDSDFTSIKIEDFETIRIEKNFKNLESIDKIHIFETSSDIVNNEYIDIYYDEYEFFGHTKVIEKSGNIFKNQKFVLDKEINDPLRKTSIIITDIKDDQIEFEILQKGAYFEPPEENAYFISENGAKILLDFFYKKTNVKNFQSNFIKDVTHGDGFMVLHLLNNLPYEIKTGKVVTNKILIKTKSQFAKKNKDNEVFYIIDKKIPYLDLPYPEIEDEVANKMFEDILFKIDHKLALLEKKVEEIINLKK